MELKDWVTYICTGAGLVAALVALPPSRMRAPFIVASIVLFAGAGVIGIVDHEEEAGSALPLASAGPAASPTNSDLVPERTVSVDLLQTGDCIAGGDLRLDNTDIGMPDSTQVLSCNKPHDGEMLLTAYPWTADTKFPGDDAVDKLTNIRCEEAFRSYIGVDYEESVLEYVGSDPSSDSWESGDRRISCIAYDPQGKLTESVRRAGR